MAKGNTRLQIRANPVLYERGLLIIEYMFSMPKMFMKSWEVEASYFS